MKFNSIYKNINDHARREWLKRERWERRARKARAGKKGSIIPCGPWFPPYEDGLLIIPERFCKSPEIALEHARKKISEHLDIDREEKAYIGIEQSVDERGHLFWFDVKPGKEMPYDGENDYSDFGEYTRRGFRGGE